MTAGPLTSVEDAVTPTVEPLAAPSATVLAAASLSIGADGRDIGHADGEGLRTRQRAVAGLRGDGVGVPRRGFVVDLGVVGDGNDSGRGIDGEAAARGVADQRVGHGRAVDVGGRRRDADRSSRWRRLPRPSWPAASLSTGADGATSVTAMVKVCELVSVPSLACAVTV